MVSACEALEREATAETARVISSAYGVEAATFCCAFTMRAVAISSWARVICLVAFTEAIRRRYTRSWPAMSVHPFPLLVVPDVWVTAIRPCAW